MAHELGSQTVESGEVVVRGEAFEVEGIVEHQAPAISIRLKGIGGQVAHIAERDVEDALSPPPAHDAFLEEPIFIGDRHRLVEQLADFARPLSLIVF